jgi:hypothetical protein
MKRAETIRTIAVMETLASVLRESLAADAVAEIEQEGTTPAWKAPGFSVTVSTTNSVVVVTDPAKFADWVGEHYPTELYEVTETRVREAWQRKFLAEVLKRGDPPCDDDGAVVPGLQYRPGGGFRSVSLTPERATKDRLKAVAHEYVTGVRELPVLAPEDPALT